MEGRVTTMLTTSRRSPAASLNWSGSPRAWSMRSRSWPRWS